MTHEFFSWLEALLKNAYAPYSNFPVAAIIKGASGAIYSGVNVENAAYPQGGCAEASAIALAQYLVHQASIQEVFFRMLKQPRNQSSIAKFLV